MNVAAQVAVLADAIHPWASAWNPIAMLYAYADDTGTHRGTRIVGYSCLFGAAKNWELLESKWASVLTSYGLTDFHSFDVENRMPPFDQLEWKAVEPLFLELSRVIVDCEVRHVTVAVEQSAWEDVVLGLAEGAAFLGRYKSPFMLCVEHCLQFTAEWSKLNANSEPVAFVANAQQDDDEIRALFDVYKTSQRWAVIMDSLDFRTRRQSAPLQAADLVAREVYKHWVNENKAPIGSCRTPLKVLHERDGLKFSRFYNRDGLLTAIQRFQQLEEPV